MREQITQLIHAGRPSGACHSCWIHDDAHEQTPLRKLSGSSRPRRQRMQQVTKWWVWGGGFESFLSTMHWPQRHAHSLSSVATEGVFSPSCTTRWRCLFKRFNDDHRMEHVAFILEGEQRGEERLFAFSITLQTRVK